MASNKEVLNELDQLHNLKILVQAYEEIAASYMRRIRSSVLQSRGFLSGLANVFVQVKASYRSEIVTFMKQKKIKDPKKLTFAKHNGKTAYVLLSANTGLYGDIVKRTYQLFLEHIRNLSKLQQQVEIVIIGRLGVLLFKEERLPFPYSYFDFPDNIVDTDSLKKITSHLLEFEKIIVFYGQFQNVVYQKATTASVSGDEISQESVTPTTPQATIKYFFEPSLKHILSFFEKEILASIFEQTIHESQLAKFASRMVTLDLAVDNIKGRLKNVQLDFERQKHRLQNKKQQQSLSGVTLWKGARYAK